MHKLSTYNPSEINQRAEALIESASNHYQITIKVANRAKRCRYEDFDNSDTHPKPVIRAIIEMSNELSELGTINDFTGNTIGIEFSNSSQKQENNLAPTINTLPPVEIPSKPLFTPLPAKLLTTSSINSQITNVEIYPAKHLDVYASPQILRQEANSKAWEQLVTWIGESAVNLNFSAAELSVERLKLSFRGKSCREISHFLIVQKSIQAAGVDLIRGIPHAEDILSGLAKYELPEIAKLAAEMVYQIAAIYGFDLQSPDREIEAITVFSATFLGEQAIAAGIDWLQCDWFSKVIVSAGAKALMLYAVGNAACLFYEAKLKSRYTPLLNPLTSSSALDAIRKESQQYLVGATSESAIAEIISGEIKTVLTIDYSQLESLLKNRRWKQADLETCSILLKIASRDPESNLKKIASEDIRIIDQLWSKNSNSHFSFKAQKQIYLSTSKNVGKFGEEIGWRGAAGLFGGVLGWKSYGWLTFNLDKAPKGHLPAAFCLTLPWWYHKGEVARDFVESILQRKDW